MKIFLITILIYNYFLFLIHAQQQNNNKIQTQIVKNTRQIKCKINLTLPSLSYSILNQGQIIKVPLDTYFPFANNYTVLEQDSSPNYKEIFDVNFNLSKIQVQQKQQMSGNITLKDNTNITISLSQNKILDIKTIYNQPNKIFLLQKNIIMMYSYRQKSKSNIQKNKIKQNILYQEYIKQKNISSDNNYTQITIVNISAEFTISQFKNYQLNCYQMEALPLQGGYKLIVICKFIGQKPYQNRTYLVAFNMKQDNRGFITHLTYNSSTYIEFIFKSYQQKYNYFTNFIINLSQQNQSQSSNKHIFFNIIKRNIKKIKINHILKQSQSQLNNQQKTNKKAARDCLQYHLKYFQKIVIQKQAATQTVIAYCNNTGSDQSNRGVYRMRFQKQRLTVKQMMSQQSNCTYICFVQSKYIAQYQNGFVSLKLQRYGLNNYYYRLYKYQYKFSNNSYYIQCGRYRPADLTGYRFITSRNQSGVQTIYAIKPDQILIFESYSPNYQTLKINNQNLLLKSYAISNQILSLHYENKQSTILTIQSYDIKAMYPHLIDKMQFKISPSTQIYLFSVMNYLQQGNYFFIYQRQRNILNLTYYRPQQVTITIKDNYKAVGNHKITIVNTSTQLLKSNNFNQPLLTTSLTIYLKIRDICDASIQIIQQSPVKLNSKLFNLDLVKTILGPLGKFYKMNNSQTSLQFVNYFHQIDVSDILNHFDGKKLMTFSIDTFLNDPMLTFYFQNFLILECDLQFDFYLMRPVIARCIQVVDTQTTQINPQQIMIYEQGRFITHQGHIINFCRISTNRDTICFEGDFDGGQNSPIRKIKLIKYQQIDQLYDLISVFVISDHLFRQKDYILKNNATVKQDLQILLKLQITQNEIQYLKVMTIKTVQYDEGYDKFLVIYMMDYFNPVTNQQNCNQQTKQGCNLNQTFFHIVQIYSKPQVQLDETTHFVGHLIEQFTSIEGQQLQNVFIIDNKIIFLSINQTGSSIKQYIIQDFKCIQKRIYPLYDYSITKNGSHAINSGFLFVQVQQLQQQISKFLIYNPSLNTTNIVTHQFDKIQKQKILFIQKINPSDNVMAIHGNYLITLSLPNMVVKLKQNQPTSYQSNNFNYINKKNYKQSSIIVQDNQQLKLSSFIDVSFIDKNHILNILSYEYLYDISNSKIQYNHQWQDQINFTTYNCHFLLQIQPSQITGPVAQYSISNHTQLAEPYDQKKHDLCQYIQINSSDIFTKTRCIKYNHAKQDGIMQDFITYEAGPSRDFTIIVTDRKILCIQQMSVNFSVIKNKTKQCSIFEQQSKIFIICVQNSNTTITMLQMQNNCRFLNKTIQKPDVLKYNLFRMIISNGQAIFQVPIKSQTNKIYYVTQFIHQNNTFNQSLMLLKHKSQQEFTTKDFTTYDNLMFLLEQGLGIYNLSKRNNNSTNTPDFWISKETLMEQFKQSQELAYINCLNIDYDNQLIVLQIGTTFNSFQLHLDYKYNTSSSSIYIVQMTVTYTYKNPQICYNTLLSKSRYYKDMTIKMCSYQPQQHYIFSNFIPITQNKQNSYIIFYQKNFNTNQSYPFRMDIIYTNIYSNDNFQIPKNKAKLMIGSLFNLLCQYDLRDSYKINFTINSKLQSYIQDNQNIQLQKKCKFYLNLSNQNTYKPYNITIKMDFQKSNNLYWTDWKYWIQRVAFVLIILNFVRLQYNKRQQDKRSPKLKIKRSRSGSMDQQFDLQVKFLSKKSL